MLKKSLNILFFFTLLQSSRLLHAAQSNYKNKELTIQETYNSFLQKILCSINNEIQSGTIFYSKKNAEEFWGKYHFEYLYQKDWHNFCYMVVHHLNSLIEDMVKDQDYSNVPAFLIALNTSLLSKHLKICSICN